MAKKPEIRSSRYERAQSAKRRTTAMIKAVEEAMRFGWLRVEDTGVWLSVSKKCGKANWKKYETLQAAAEAIITAAAIDQAMQVSGGSEKETKE